MDDIAIDDDIDQIMRDSLRDANFHAENVELRRPSDRVYFKLRQPSDRGYFKLTQKKFIYSLSTVSH